MPKVKSSDLEYDMASNSVHRKYAFDGAAAASDPKLSCLPDRHQLVLKDKGIDISHFLQHPSPSTPDEADSAVSLKRHIAASLIQHHRAIQRSNRALQPVSPESHGSSMGIASFNLEASPSSSLDFNGRVVEPRYKLRASTELLKALNKIWNLEEQHASNVSLIRALKVELENARIMIKELVRDKQADRRDMEELMKQITDEKLARKGKEHERFQNTIQSAKEEVEDERNLRKRSESLHRKLAKELAEVKASLSKTLAEAEREKKYRTMLEELCHEFAKSIKVYDQEVRSLKQRFERNWMKSDNLIVQLSESWLDELTQMKHDQTRHGDAGSRSMLDKLRNEIETFLHAKKVDTMKTAEKEMTREREISMESVPLNAVLSELHAVVEDEEGKLNCLFINNPRGRGLKNLAKDVEVRNGNQSKKGTPSRNKSSIRKSQMGLKIEEQMLWTTPVHGHTKPSTPNPNETNVPLSAESYISTRDGGSSDRHSKSADFKASKDSFARTRVSQSGGSGSHNQDSELKAMENRTVVDASASSTKRRPGFRENTLKTKLLEARFKSPGSKLRILKAS